jgi:hypothetical protein
MTLERSDKAQAADLILFFLSVSRVQNAGPFPGRRSDCDPLHLVESDFFGVAGRRTRRRTARRRGNKTPSPVKRADDGRTMSCGQHDGRCLDDCFQCRSVPGQAGA